MFCNSIVFSRLELGLPVGQMFPKRTSFEVSYRLCLKFLTALPYGYFLRRIWIRNKKCQFPVRKVWKLTPKNDKLIIIFLSSFFFYWKAFFFALSTGFSVGPITRHTHTHLSLVSLVSVMAVRALQWISSSTKYKYKKNDFQRKWLSEVCLLFKSGFTNYVPFSDFSCWVSLAREWLNNHFVWTVFARNMAT